MVADGESILAPQATTILIGHVVAERANPRPSARAAQRANRPGARDGHSRRARQDERRHRPRALPQRGDRQDHTTRIFAKLDLTNRVQAAIFAYQAGLVVL